MDPDLVLRRIRETHAALPSSRRTLLEHLCVYDWFDPAIVAYTADALGLAADTAGLLGLPMVEARPLAATEEFRVRPLLRKDLVERLGEEGVPTLGRAHRLAAAYYHQPLDPFRTDRVGWYVAQIRHMAWAGPGSALNRLAAFSHTALLAGHPEAASRAAAEALKAGPQGGGADAGRRELSSLAQVVRAVALILAASEVEDRTIVDLDGLLAGARPPRDLAAARIHRLARDLVTYYSERLAPAPTLSAALVPGAVRGVERRGAPEISASLSIAEEFAHFPHTVMRRDHVVELVGRHKARHAITSTLYMQATGEPTTHAVVDIFPWDAGDDLDRLDVRDANGGVVPSLKRIEVQAYIANAVSYWLSDDSASTEISRSLSAALRSRQHETVEALLRTATEATEGDLGHRIRAATRYLPLVAQLDTGYGTSQRLRYGYDGGSTLQRHGLIGVSAELDLVLPTQAPNHLTVPAPEGVELAGIGFGDRNWVLEPVSARSDRHEEAQEGLPDQFLVRFRDSGDDDSSSAPPSHRLARTTMQLLYVPRRKDIRRVVRVNLLCLGICLLAVGLPFLVDHDVWSSLIPGLATAFVLVEPLIQSRRPHASGQHEEIHAYANRRLNVIYAVNVLAALLATSAAPANQVEVFLSLSLSALAACLASTVVLLSCMARRRALLEAAAAGLEGRGRFLASSRRS
ncbi:hypothetical protein ABZ128_25955 [Streptomyces sp. NPDC006326]|uniref:hypothetical protein n=1 Tax=Streptomyces sp. NPDC006326 TaxID=3156752 RepID=UPI0033A119B0